MPQRCLADRHHTWRNTLGLVLLACALPLAAAATPARQGSEILVAANQGEASISIFDTYTGKELAKVPEGDITAHEVTLSADAKTAYLPIYGNSSVGEPGSDGQELVAIDLASHKIINRLVFGHAVRPHCVVLNPRDGLLYVTTELDHTVTVVNPLTLEIAGVIPTGQSESHMLALSHDGRFGYVSNVGPGTISVLDLKARKLLAIIPVADKTERISVSADDRLLFTADQGQARLAVIDAETHEIRRWVPLPAPGYGTASTHDGRYLLVALLQASQIAVVDLKTLQVIRTIDVPHKPIEVLVTSNDDMAYVSCGGSGKVAAIRLADWTVQRTFDAGRHVDGIAWASTR